MSEWFSTTLGNIEVDFIDGDRGKNYPSQNDFNSDGYCLFLNTKNVRKNGFDFSSLQFITEVKDSQLRKGKLQIGDIVLTTRGTIGNTALYNKEILFKNIRINSGMVIIRTNPLSIHNIYFLYFLRDLDYESIISGSAQPQLPIRDLKKVELMLPPLLEQKAIASVLSALDNKIDLLHRQNKTLESMAETLFRQWFVEEANNVWPLVPLSSYIKCINGVSYKSSELKDSSTALVTLKNFSRDGGLRADGFKEFVGNYKESQLVIDKDIVVAHTDLTQDASLIGNPIYVQNIHNYTNLVISMDLVKVELISDSLTKEFLFYLLKSSDFKEHALSCSNGSSVIHLSKKALPSFIFKLPPNILVTKFTDIVQLLNHKGSDNQKQIQTLEKLRDTLLPKLMSGEVRVNYTPEEITQ